MSPLVSDISYHQGNQGDRVTSFRYRYDNVGNIESAEQSDSVRGTIAKSTYRYDRFNQLIQEERDGKTWFYQYDTVGNLLWVKTFDKSYDDYEEAASAVSYKPELLLDTDTYTYGDSEWQDLLTAFNGRSITYDAIGNPLTYYNGTDYTMTWEQGRRLSALHTGEKTVGYRYDSEGKRTGKTVGTGQTEYIYAGGQLVSILGTNPDYRIDLIYDESGVQSCIYTAGTAAPVTYYLIKNAQGDVMQLRDEADTIVANYAYDAFGRLLSVTDIDGKAISDQTSFAHRNPLRYRGYLYDSETGFYYLGSRYYDPKIRRFINADNNLSSASICGYNLFAYCGNNPVNRTDATGEAWWHWALGAAIVVGCAVATVATCGGFAAAAGAVAAVCAGTAAASTAATVAASAFVGSAAVYGSLSLSSLADSASVEDFNNKGNWGTVASTAGGAIVGGVNGYTVSKALTPKTVGRGMHNPKIRAAAQRGVLEHKQMDYGPNVDKEVTIASGCRVDGIDFKNRIIYELKPNNPRAIARGLSQLNRYTEAASQRYGGKWTGTLRLYD